MKKLFLIGIGMALSGIVCAQHPSIMLTKKAVDDVRAGIAKYPLLGSSYKTLKEEADKALASPYTNTHTGGWRRRHYA
jgi:hypothetical protein